jgi:hypothetical protein
VGVHRCSQLLPDLQDGKNLTRWVNQVHQFFISDATQEFTTLIDELNASMPPMKVINDPALLTSSDLQSLVFSNPRRDTLNPTVRTLQSLLATYKTAQGNGLTFDDNLKAVFKEASKVRQTAKLCIIVDWALDKIMRIKKDNIDMIQLGKEIKDLADHTKTWELFPDYLKKLVATMHTPVGGSSGSSVVQVGGSSGSIVATAAIAPAATAPKKRRSKTFA